MTIATQLVQCPLCSSGFKVKLPEKTAKGQCPKCKNSLILSPDGTVKAHSTSRAVTTEPPRPPQQEVVELPPSVVIESSIHSEETMVDIPPQLEVVSEIDETIVDPNPTATAREMLSRRPPTSRVKTGFKSGTRRFGQQAQRYGAQPVGEQTLSTPTKKPVLLSFILVILPIATCGALFAMKDSEALKNILLKVGNITTKGANKLYAIIKSGNEVPKQSNDVPRVGVTKNEHPVEPQKQPAVDPEALKRAEKGQLVITISKYLTEYRARERGLKKWEAGVMSPQQQAEVEKNKKALLELNAKIEELKKEYQDRYGEPFKE